MIIFIGQDAKLRIKVCKRRRRRTLIEEEEEKKYLDIVFFLPPPLIFKNTSIQLSPYENADYVRNCGIISS